MLGSISVFMIPIHSLHRRFVRWLPVLLGAAQVVGLEVAEEREAVA